LLGGLLLFAIVYAGFAAAHSIFAFAGLLAVYGVYMAATDGVGKAWVVDLVPADMRATGIGILGTVTGVSSLAASLAAGVLWDHFGSAGPFFYGAGGALVSFGLLLFTVRR
jgi:MFS family permease